jgi:hypothetical protein
MLDPEHQQSAANGVESAKEAGYNCVLGCPRFAGDCQLYVARIPDK